MGGGRASHPQGTSLSSLIALMISWISCFLCFEQLVSLILNFSVVEVYAPRHFGLKTTRLGFDFHPLTSGRASAFL